MRIVPLLVGAACVFAAAPVWSANAPAFTAKERAQGFRDGILLAKPQPQRRATVDAEEARERIRVQARFARLGDLRVVELAPTDDVLAAVQQLRATGRYEFVEPDYLMSPDATPTDPNFGSQWAMNNTGLQLTGAVAGDDIRALAAWDILHDAPNVIIAQIDGGVRSDHLDLAPNLWTNPSPTFGDVHGASIIRGVRSGNIEDEGGHGTHVAGIICAAANNGVATAGVVWRTQLMVLKNSGADGSSSTSDSAALVDYAVAHGAQVINCSFGGTTISQTFLTALTAARDAGVIVVCSAGNSGLSNDVSPHYPSNYLLDNIVAVGNSGPTDLASSSSDYGTAVELFAPGSAILSLDYRSTSGTVTMSGTSMAAPHVTGAVALLRAMFPNDNYRQVINRLLRSTDAKSSLAGRAQTNGRLNLYRALTSTNHRPFNDDFLTRAIITGSNIALRSNNDDATVEPVEPAHLGNGQKSLWWQWVAPITGTILMDTVGSRYDTVLEVSTGALTALTPDTLTPLTSNDDDGPNRTSRVSFSVTSGTSYFICIAGKDGSSGYTQLNISQAPANDNFAAAIPLSGDSAQATAQNNGATLEPGEPRILGYPGGGSLWYKWTAPRSATYQVSAFTFDFDTLLAVYTGNTVDRLSLVVAGDDTNSGPGITDSDSRVNLNAVAGITYYFQVDSKTSARGAVILSVTDSLWQFSTDGGAITSAPALATDGTTYVGATAPDDRLYAVAPDGTLKWSYFLGGSIDVISPAVAADGTIYQGAFNGQLVALTPAGTVKWTHSFNPGDGTINAVESSASVGADGTIYVHAADGYLYALAPADGAVKWRFNVGCTTFASATIAADGTIYQGSNGDKALYALNTDGTLKWRYDAGADTYGSPALDSAGNVYLTTYSNGRVISLTPAGTPRWTYTGVTGTSILSGSAVLSSDGSTVYVVAGDRKLHAIDASSGAARWTYTLGNSAFACTPAVDSKGVIYAGCYDGKVYAINASGTLKRTWDTAQRIRSSPVIFGTTLFVGSGDAKLYAFDIGATGAGGAWPQYHQNARLLGRAVADPLAITLSPATQVVQSGTGTTLRAAATGQGPLSFQWQKDGVAITGATSANLAITGFGTGNVGSYTVVVTGRQGSVTSTAASLDFLTNIARLTNLSILTSLDGPDDTFTLGYAVAASSSSATKPLLIRAAGPSLAALGVTGYLNDPRLQLYAGGTKVGENDNWEGTSTLLSAFSAVAAFPYAGASSRDAALLTTVPSGTNTVVVSATDKGTGKVIAELYDETPTNGFTSASARLVNVSVLKQIGSGVTAGFVISGQGVKTLLIRAVGPTIGLAPFNVPGVVADPQLAVYSGQTIVANNDNWGGGSDLAAAATTVAAFPLSAASKDAAVRVTLPAGAYTVNVTGVGGTSGAALIEIYEVP